MQITEEKLQHIQTITKIWEIGSSRRWNQVLTENKPNDDLVEFTSDYNISRMCSCILTVTQISLLKLSHIQILIFTKENHLRNIFNKNTTII